MAKFCIFFLPSSPQPFWVTPPHPYIYSAAKPNFAHVNTSLGKGYTIRVKLHSLDGHS